MQARAVVSDGKGAYSVEDIEVGAPGPGEVQVELKASGVCHTDHDLLSAPVAMVLGHEGAGVVSAVGDGVTNVAVGDAVVLNWAIPCGTCFMCTTGSQHLCENHSPLQNFVGGHAHFGATTFNGAPLLRGFSLGTMATATVVRAEAVVKVTHDVPFAAAAICGCGVMTGFGSAVNAAQIEKGASAVVLGCGGVGLNVIQGCRVAGAAMIIGVDLVDDRLDMAKRFGATHVIKPGPDDDLLLEVASQVKELTGRGADYSFECTAVPKLGAAPLAMVRHGGMAVAVSGIEQDITVDMRLFEWDKTYINPLYGQCQPERDFPKLFELYAAGDLLLDELVTRTYSIDQVDDAFADMLAGRNAKGVLLFD